MHWIKKRKNKIVSRKGIIMKKLKVLSIVLLLSGMHMYAADGGNSRSSTPEVPEDFFDKDPVFPATATVNKVVEVDQYVVQNADQQLKKKLTEDEARAILTRGVPALRKGLAEKKALRAAAVLDTVVSAQPKKEDVARHTMKAAIAAKTPQECKDCFRQALVLIAQIPGLQILKPEAKKKAE